MNLFETIESELKEAMKNSDNIKAETLRMLKSDLTYEKAKTGEDLTDEQMLEVVTRAAKRRKESIIEYEKGNRTDLAQIEADELVVIEKYLPEQMSKDEIEANIKEKINSIGQVTQKDFGRIMGELMKELKGKADGKIVKKILSKILNGNNE